MCVTYLEIHPAKKNNVEDGQRWVDMYKANTTKC